MLSGVFVRTFVIGVAVAAPVGAMAVLCVDRTLRRGWVAGMATGAGIATADGLYGAVAAFGVTAVTSVLVSAQLPLRILGGLFLIALGVRAAWSAGKQSERATEVGAGGYAALYVGAIGLTLTNPMTIIAFAAVFASAGIGEMSSTMDALGATAGISLGSLTWWLGLVTLSSLLRRGIGASARTWLGRVSGVAVAALGLYSLASSLFLT